MKGNGDVQHIKERHLKITALRYNWISALLQTPTFHFSLQIMWWFREEKQKEKSDTVLSRTSHSIVGFGIMGPITWSYLNNTQSASSQWHTNYVMNFHYPQNLKIY